ncbi:MAG: thioredoxin family protein [Actinomycetota bacterium]|nr:thioredoxin family protein [Actinomycetota bacterium]
MAAPYAFIVFTSPSCRPCKSALRVVREAADQSGGIIEVHAVDSLERQDLATSCNVRSLPTVFLVTASGRVLHRWTAVPPRHEISTYLRAA